MQWSILLEKTLPVVQQAADFIQAQAGKVQDIAIEAKSRNSLVSYVDKTAETMLVEGLKQILPDSGFITEEETVRQQEAEFTWIIDPLDGTTNFLQEIPFYSVSVALQYRDETVLGIVADIEHQAVYSAWKGGGAWRNNRPIRVSARESIAESVIVTGFPYAADDVVPPMIGVFDYFLKNAKGMRRLGSAALDLAYVAGGRLDLYYETTLHAWDVAAGILLVREAGGLVTDFANAHGMLRNGEVIAANPSVHAEAVKVIRRFYNP